MPNYFFEPFVITEKRREHIADRHQTVCAPPLHQMFARRHRFVVFAGIYSLLFSSHLHVSVQLQVSV